MSEHHHSIKPYALVLAALLVLTVVTYSAALIDFGHPWSDVIALVIALAKASLVVMFFMHVKGSTPLIKLAAAGGFFWLLVFFAFMLSDYLERSTLVVGW